MKPSPMRVLVVDDDPDNARTLALFLGLCGHEARAVTEPGLVLAEAREFRPDAVVLDLAMPGLDGFAVAEALRADPATAGARLAAVTGRCHAEDNSRAEELGFAAVLIKPADPARLIELLGCPDQG